MDNDYPSAHSMDTQWFAVDQDGHVGVFRSGEAGAVPMAAFAGDETYRAQERLRQLLPAGQAIRDLRGRTMPGVEPGNAGRGAYTGQFPVLLFLTSLDPVRDAIASGEAVEMAVTEGVAVLFRRLDDATLNRYHELPEFRGSGYVFTGEDGEDPSLARFGFYAYEHLTENWISGPYGREAIPQTPLHIDQLPPDLRRRVGSIRFDGLRFADTLHLQPVELTECASWEAAWMDVTGKHVRPIPGKEEEYAEAYDNLADIAESGEIEVEPPRADEE